jgi:hypothetical protein
LLPVAAGGVTGAGGLVTVLGAALAFQGLRGRGPHSRGVTVCVGLAGVAFGVVALVLVR